MSSNQPPRRRRIAGERRRQTGVSAPSTPSTPPTPAQPSTPPAAGPDPAAPTTSTAPTTPPEQTRPSPRVSLRKRRPAGSAPVAAPVPARTGRGGWWGSTQSLVALGVALALLVTLVVLGALGLLGNDGIGDVRSAEDAEVAAESAPSVAERAAEAILAYDHQSLDADRDAAAKFMTDEFAEKYSGTFDKTVKPAARTYRATVTAQVEGSSVIRASQDRVRVLLFVDQTTRSTAHDRPQVALNRVEFDMVREDGEWLVDDISSY